MSYKASTSPNASGLGPEESQKLPDRQPRVEETKIIAAIKELYACKPLQTTYDVYTKDAVFHDPVGIAEGIDSIKAQFNALAKIFPRADIPKFRVLENPANLPQSTILIDQDVAYYRDASSSSPTKTVNSLLTIHTNAEHKVVRHIEEWNHRHSTSRDDGYLGFLNEQRKRFTAAVTDRMTSKEPPQKD